MNIKQIYNNNKNGFTLVIKEDNKTVEKPFLLNKGYIPSGYIVAITDIKTNRLNLDITFKNLYKIATKINADYVFIGGWNDDKNFYLDISILAPDLNTTAILKELFNQKEVFNLKTWECL